MRRPSPGAARRWWRGPRWKAGGRAAWLGAVLGVLSQREVLPLYAQATYTVFPVQSHKSAGADARQPTKGGASRVTLVVRDSTIDYAINAIARQAHLRLVYNNASPQFAKRVSVRLVGAPATEAIAAVLKGTGIVAKMAADRETMVFHVMAAGEKSEKGEQEVFAEGVITGRVTDSTSEKGIGGATVLVKGTALRTTTSDNGQFTLKAVPAGEQTLTVRAFGYKPQTLTVTVTDSEHTVLNVALVPTRRVLSGVVTQVSGVQERRQVGTDVTVLNADSIMQVAPVSTVTDLLETHVTGLSVLRQSGVPGAPRRLRLRGTSSIERSNAPIYIVDGIRVGADSDNTAALDQIDPNSIETIEVFKGPSASSMYGADAGNGVIVITTKRGKAGRTRWNLALDGGRTSLPSGGYPLNTFRFGHSLAQLGPEGNNLTHLCSFDDGYCDVTDSVVRYQALNDPRFNVFNHGATRQASLTVSGGTGNLTYALTGSASSETGLFQLPAIEAETFQQQHGFAPPGWMRHPDRYSTWGGNSRLDLPLTTGGATVALTNSYFQSQQQGGSFEGVIGQLLGRYVDTTLLVGNPLFQNYYTRVLNGQGTLTTGVTLHWPVRNWLPIDATGGLNIRTTDNRSVTPAGYLVGYSGACGQGSITTTTCIDTVGSYSLAQGQSLQQTLNGGTTLLLPSRGGVPGVRLPIGFNWQALSATGFNAMGSHLLPGVLDPTQLGPYTYGGPSQSRVSTTTYGWYMAPTLDFGHGLYWSPGFRFDGGSASGSNAGLSLFPKLDLAWVAIDQPEQPVLGAITLLRPRIAFGIAGVQPDPTQQYRLLTQETFTTVDGTVLPVALVGSYGNTKLVPERSRELEGGFDTELWNQRLTLSVTPYYKLRYHAILTSQIAPSAGVATGFNTGTAFLGGGGAISSYAYNVGTIRNSGVNATVGARVLDSRRALWQVTANISKNTNELLSLAPGVRPTLQGGLVPGYPLNSIWARPLAGYVDANHNGRIDFGEVRLADGGAFLGATDPNYELTLSTTLSLFNGRVSVNTTADYQNGMTQTYQAAGNSGNPLIGNALTSALNDPTTPLSRQAEIIAGFCPSGESATTSCGASLYGLTQVVNTLRWQSLSVNYTVPTSLTHRLGLGALAVALQGSNLGLHSNYRGKDPNVGVFTGGDTGQLPQPRLWQLRVTVGN